VSSKETPRTTSSTKLQADKPRPLAAAAGVGESAPETLLSQAEKMSWDDFLSLDSNTVNKITKLMATRSP